MKTDYLICTMLDCQRAALNYIDSTGTCRYVMLADDRKKPDSVLEVIKDICGRTREAAALWMRLMRYAKDTEYGNDEWRAMNDIEECAREVVEIASICRTDHGDGMYTFHILCFKEC